MRLFIEPLEPLSFRSGLPFDAGEGNLAISTFPPTPETLQGAVRALIASIHHPQASMATAFADPDLTALIGNREEYGRFQITQIGLGRHKEENANEVELLLPAPAHILQDEHKKRLRLAPKAISEMMVYTNEPEGITHVLALQNGKAETKLEPLQGWLTQASLLKSLHPDTSLDELKVVKPECIYERESRLGIGMDTVTKRTRDGYLYQQQVIRMREGYGFVIDIGLRAEANEYKLLADKLVWEKLFLKKEQGWLTLGGEQRAARFRVVEQSPSPVAAQPEEGTLLYLATPAYFPSAWKPSKQFAPLDKPITAAVSRAEIIGGWRLNPGDANGDQKGLRFCVPAGSIFFYDTKVSATRPLTEYGEQIGYGITYRGDWKV